MKKLLFMFLPIALDYATSVFSCLADKCLAAPKMVNR